MNFGFSQQKQFQEGLLIKKTLLEVIKNDLTLEQVDIIVNAANNYMKHGGGLARAIVKGGGDIIQEESYNEVKKKGGFIKTGQVIITGAGQLNCRYIIHAVGPVWQGGQKNELNLLFEAVQNSLSLASENSVKTISIPAISSGIFGLPKNLCAQTLFKSAIQYIEQNKQTTLQKIRFVNFDDETVNEFKIELEKQKQNYKNV